MNHDINDKIFVEAIKAEFIEGDLNIGRSSIAPAKPTTIEPASMLQTAKVVSLMKAPKAPVARPVHGQDGMDGESDAPKAAIRKMPRLTGRTAPAHRGMRMMPPDPDEEPFAAKPEKTKTEAVVDEEDELAAYLGADRFPIEALPLNLRVIIKEIADNKRVHPEMIFMHLLALASACIGSRRTLCPHAEYHATWHEPAIFWGMIIGSSGDGKSPTMKVIFRSLRKAQYEEEKRYDEKYKKYERDMDIWNQEEHNPDDQLPIEPHKKQYYVDDTTMEAIHAILMHNRNGIMWLKDEIRSLIKNLDKYTNGSSIDVLLSLWSGFAWTKNRASMKKRGAQASDTVPDALVGVYGGIQPGVFERFFTLDDIFSGLAQRFFFCVPTAQIRKTLKTPAVSRGVLDELDDITRQMLALHEIAEPLYLSSEAFEIFNDFYEVIGNAEPRSFLMKATNNTLRLALMLHYLAGQEDTEIDAWEMEAAIKIMKWFLVTLFRRVLPLLESKPSKTAEMVAIDQAREVYIVDFLNQHPEITRATSAALMKAFGPGHPFNSKSDKPSARILGKALTAMGFVQDRNTGDRVYDLTKRAAEPAKKQGIITPDRKIILNAGEISGANDGAEF